MKGSRIWRSQTHKIGNSGMTAIRPSEISVIAVSIIIAIGRMLVAEVVVVASVFGWVLSEALNTHQRQGELFLTLMMWVGSIVGGIVFVVAFIIEYTDPSSRTARVEYR